MLILLVLMDVESTSKLVSSLPTITTIFLSQGNMNIQIDPLETFSTNYGRVFYLVGLFEWYFMVF